MLGLCAAVAVSALLMVAWMTTMRPSWWPQLDAESAPTVDLAERVEHGVVRVCSQVRPDADGNDPYASAVWTLRMTEDEANAWLAARLPRWIESRQGEWPWVRSIGRVRVRFEPDGLRIGAEMLAEATGGDMRVMSVKGALAVDDAGKVLVSNASVSVGRVTVPAGAIEMLMPDLAREQGILLRALAGKGPLLERAELKLEDGRRVRVVGVRVSGGAIELDCVTGR